MKRIGRLCLEICKISRLRFGGVEMQAIPSSTIPNIHSNLCTQIVTATSAVYPLFYHSQGFVSFRGGDRQYCTSHWAICSRVSVFHWIFLKVEVCRFWKIRCCCCHWVTWNRHNMAHLIKVWCMCYHVHLFIYVRLSVSALGSSVIVAVASWLLQNLAR